MTEHAADHSNPEIRKLGELIKDIKIAMMITSDPDGQLRGRPMMCQEAEFDGDLWFLTSKSSGKMRSIESDEHVNISYADPNDHKFVSVNGLTEIVHDDPKKRELWKPAYKAWFPKGVDDPDIVLLKVRVQGAEYWDTPSGGFVQLAGFVKTMLTGQPHALSRDEHAKLNLRH